MTTATKDGSIEFRFFRPGAHDVKLAGDFNRWTSANPMRPDIDGWWVASLELEPGEYRFRYIADGTWFTDFASNGVEVSTFGWNSVLIVAGTPRRDECKDVKQVQNKPWINASADFAMA